MNSSFRSDGLDKFGQAKQVVDDLGQFRIVKRSVVNVTFVKGRSEGAKLLDGKGALFPHGRWWKKRHTSPA